MSEKLRQTIVYSFQLLIILTPLIWTTTTSELFEFPKMLFAYAAAIIIVGLWLARMIIERRLIFTSTPWLLPLGIFLLSQLLSTIFSIDVHTSIFGYYSRFNGGLLSLLSYALLYTAAVSNLTKSDATKILFAFVFAGIITSLYAFPEHFGHSPSCLIISGQFHAKCWVQDVQTRVFGTFGQPNWLAAYLISIIFIPLAKTIDINPTSKFKNSKLLGLWYFLFGFFFIVLLFTKSRSGLIGFGIGLTIFSILTYKHNLKRLLISYFLILISFLFFGRGISATTDKIFTLFPTTSTTTPTPLPDQPPANSLDINITPSSQIRQIVWKGAINLALKYPLFGSGVETFAYSYYNVRPVEHNLVSEWDFLYNKAHNEFLNYAATTGFVGLFAYTFLLGSFVISSFKKLHQANTLPEAFLANRQHSEEKSISRHNIDIAALLAGFIALSISNFFGFSTVPVQLVLFLYPAIAYLYTSDPHIHPNPSHKLNPSQYLGLFILVIFCFYLLSRVHLAYAADRLYTAGKSARQAKDYQTAVSKLEAAVKSLPNEPLYTDELGLTASEIAASLAATNHPQQASQAATIAIELANRTLNLNRVHLNFYKTRAKIFLNLSQVNPRYALEALATLKAAVRLAPTDAKLWLNLAMLTDQLGDPHQALKLYQHTLSLKPNYDLARSQLANLEARLATTSTNLNPK